MFCLAVVNQANGSSTLKLHLDVIGAAGAPDAAAIVSIAVAAAKLAVAVAFA